MRLARIFALWSLTFAATAVFVVLHRPPGFIGILAANLFGVLICYLMMPLPVKLQALTALAISVGHGVISLVVNPISDPVLRNTFVFMFVSANVIGFFSSRLMHRSRRREYATQVDLLNAEQQYRTLVDASGSTVWTMLPDLTVDFVNKPWIEMTGHDSGRRLPDQWSAIVHPDDAAEFVDGIALHVDSGDLFETVVRLLRHDGEYRWVLSRMLPLRSESGNVEKWIGTTTDIHDHWVIKLKLREANARLEEAAGRVRQLEEILSICSHCKKIRDENENWQPLESYISARTETLFSHSICPACGVEHYGEIGKRLFGGNDN